jgi:hypothetical protein
VLLSPLQRVCMQQAAVCCNSGCSGAVPRRATQGAASLVTGSVVGSMCDGFSFRLMARWCIGWVGVNRPALGQGYG